MAVTNEELKTLQPGDMIVIISEEEAKDGGFWYGEQAGWAIGSGDPDDLNLYNMNSFCGKSLTVENIYTNDGIVKVLVKETGFWWKVSFISEIIRDEQIVPIEKEDLLALIYGGETYDI